MTVLKMILCCLFVSFAVHYGWKMRGTVVGGEKGAMVPGLFAGLILALFAGGKIAENFWIPAAAGLGRKPCRQRPAPAPRSVFSS